MAKHGTASLFAVALILGVFAAIPTAVESIGVCNGGMGDNLPSASDVVKLYVANGINAMRIYSPDTNTLNALSGTNIDLLMDLGGSDQVSALASDPSAATTWVQNNVQAFPGVSFKYIAVGNEVAGNTGDILPAMKNMDSALAAAGLSHIKVSTAVQSGVTAGFPPSQGTFSQSYMAPIAQYLQSTGAPLLCNVYPYFAYIGNQAQIDINYALFTSQGTVVQDGGNGYQNLFDAMVDTFYSALESAGAGNVPIVVSESGWPSAGGGPETSVSNAQTYNQNLINNVGNGTPKRPGPIEAYIFAMFNEDLKPNAETEKHFGLFNPDQSPVYPINF